jgi:hypothetical protein
MNGREEEKKGKRESNKEGKQVEGGRNKNREMETRCKEE